MSRLGGLARFLWDFVVGDDWRVALAVVIALGVTAIIGHVGWFLLPVVVLAILAVSVLSVAAKR